MLQVELLLVVTKASRLWQPSPLNTTACLIKQSTFNAEKTTNECGDQNPEETESQINVQFVEMLSWMIFL